MVATVTDSATTVTTLTATVVPAATKTRVQLVRDGANLFFRVNGVTVTGTMSATNLVQAGNPIVLGADNAATFYDGAIDFFRGWRTALTSQKYGFLRNPHPRGPSVMFDYVGSLDANGIMLDRGPYEMHGVASGTPASTRAPLAPNSDPVLFVTSGNDNNTTRQGYAGVRDRVYPVKFLS
jgi:hypothetical protein